MALVPGLEPLLRPGTLGVRRRRGQVAGCVPFSPGSPVGPPARSDPFCHTRVVPFSRAHIHGTSGPRRGASRSSASSSPPATSRRRSTQLAEKVNARGEGRRPARRDRHRQVGDDGLADRAGAAPDAGHGAEQDARRAAGQRVPGAAARTTRSSTSSRTTTTTSPRRTSRRRDTYIEKDSSVNDEIERLRHSATQRLLTRRDVVVVATVSCIYGLGAPQEYVERSLKIEGAARPASATSCCAPWSPSSTPATTSPSPAARSACGATRSRSSRSTRSSPSGSRCSATRSSGSTTCTR